MRRCPITYEPLTEGRYSGTGLRLLSRRLQSLDDLEFTPQELRREALARSTKMSLQGLQPKLSARLNVRGGRFEIVDRGGRYILKPPLVDYPEIPENEDLTMRMAAEAGIELPLHGMIYTADSSLCYFIHRFDRAGRGKKLPTEDFAQLLGRSRETKYDSSVENVISGINEHCTFPVLERVKLLRRILFSFLCGNEDMHLKNYSVIGREGKVELSPAYGLLNTTIVLANPREEFALPIAGKKSNLSRAILLDYLAFERLKLTPRAVDAVLRGFRAARPSWDRLLRASFLSSEMRTRYQELVVERWQRLGL